MDIFNINKVINRKNMTEDAEKLREKVSREAAKIIKLKVGQDTAYWDLKEKLQQVEANHERLQQNMVEVQMQHETLSGQYQEELRIRPETLNKMVGTRELCEVLEEYSGRLKASVSRCKADQGALGEAYAASAQRVLETRAQLAHAHDLQTRTVQGLQEKLKVTAEHQNQMVQYLRSALQQSEMEAKETRARCDRTLGEHAQLTAQLQRCETDLAQKDTVISSLKSDLMQLTQEFESHSAKMKQIIALQEKDLSSFAESKESLEKALRIQETIVSEAQETIRKLNDQLAEMTQSRDHESQTNATLQQQLKEAKATVDGLILSQSELEEIIKKLELEVSDKIKIIGDKDTEIDNLAARVTNLELEKSELTSELTVCTNQRDHNADILKETKTQILTLETKLQDAENDLVKYRESSEGKVKELEEKLETKEAECTAARDAITRLMGDVHAQNERANRAEGERERAQRDAETAARKHETETAGLRDSIQNLKITVASKENELADQMKIILEMRSEKERMEKKSEDMQNMINNIEKELMGRNTKAMDKGQEQPVRLEQNDSMLFNFLSDSSVDGIDQAVVERRFEALSRGERLPPEPLLRKRRAHEYQMAPPNKHRTFFKTKRADAKNKKDNK